MVITLTPNLPSNCVGVGCNGKRFRTESDLLDFAAQVNDKGDCLCEDCRRNMSDHELELWQVGR